MNNKKFISFVLVIVALLSIILFVKIFNNIMDPRNGSVIHLSEKNKVLEYESVSNWLGDGNDYEIYRFSDSQMKEIIDKVENNKSWEKYPIDSTTLDCINKWHGFIKNDSAALEIMEEHKLKDFIPYIESGYYSLVDRSSNQSVESKNKYGLRNFTVFLLDIDNNTLYYIALDM